MRKDDRVYEGKDDRAYGAGDGYGAACEGVVAAEVEEGARRVAHVRVAAGGGGGGAPAELARVAGAAPVVGACHGSCQLGCDRDRRETGVVRRMRVARAACAARRRREDGGGPCAGCSGCEGGLRCSDALSAGSLSK